MSSKRTIVVDYKRIEKEIWRISEPLVVSCGAELVDVELVKEAGSWYLRLFIDRALPVDHNLCEQVSNLVGAALDREDPIETSYYLEISSPGLERPLKREDDFARFTGREIVVKLYAAKEGKKEYTGRLIGLVGNDIVMEINGLKTGFPLPEVARAHLKADI